MTFSLLDANIGDKIIFNHKMTDISDPIFSDIHAPSCGLVFYEVIRCIDQTLLFFDDHMNRLEESVKGVITIDKDNLFKEIHRLLETLNIQNGNIKILFTEDMQLINLNSHYYPSTTQYDNGVATGLLEWERIDPNVKAVREDYKNAIKAKINQPGPFGQYFETLLYNKDGGITEGSRSNVFFIKDDLVITAPDEYILKGITRKYVLNAIRNAGGILVTKMISSKDLECGIDAAFLSGTSIDVLPISSIEHTRISSSSNDLVLRIMREYREIVTDYLKNVKINNNQGMQKTDNKLKIVR